MARNIYHAIVGWSGDAWAPASVRFGNSAMMIVPTYVGPSEIEGVGVFAAAPIKAGTAIWTLADKFDLILPTEELEDLPEVQRSFIERYGYPHMTRPGLTVLEFDNGRFMNHTDMPNADFTKPDIAWAIRDIAEGEEITCNYAEFDPSFVMLPGRNFVDEPRRRVAGLNGG